MSPLPPFSSDPSSRPEAPALRSAVAAETFLILRLLLSLLQTYENAKTGALTGSPSPVVRVHHDVPMSSLPIPFPPPSTPRREV